MRRESYEPRPGTVAFRALAYLETLPQGAEVMTSALAEALRLDDYKTLAPCLEAAVKGGAVFQRKRDDHARSPWWWSLTDFSALPKAPRPAAVAFELVDEVPVFVKPAQPEPEPEPEPAPTPQPRPKRPAPRIEEGPTTKDDQGFRACLWTNGVLQIEREPGDLVLIAPPHVEQIRRLLMGGGQ